MTQAYLCDAVRTPFRRYGGALSAVAADDLAAHVQRALKERHAALAPAAVDVTLGCANQAGEDNRNLARMDALLAGLPVSVPGTTVKRRLRAWASPVGERSAARDHRHVSVASHGRLPGTLHHVHRRGQGHRGDSRAV